MAKVIPLEDIRHGQEAQRLADEMGQCIHGAALDVGLNALLILTSDSIVGSVKTVAIMPMCRKFAAALIRRVRYYSRGRAGDN